MKKYLATEKSIGIFQSIMLILFLFAFFFILFLVFSKPKKYYQKISILPLEDKKQESI
ncbi:cytochrome oxidase [Blattabacterium cuenoti]|uniref:cytochrome oxidase n=1 Tax=Blattabacterium cuenoti TaxID=1653831 RepID=UPI001EEA7FC8|nr:cytochrome oxidase [Blattabacterium cuenoti]